MKKPEELVSSFTNENKDEKVLFWIAAERSIKHGVLLLTERNLGFVFEDFSSDTYELWPYSDIQNVDISEAFTKVRLKIKMKLGVQEFEAPKEDGEKFCNELQQKIGSTPAGIEQKLDTGTEQKLDTGTEQVYPPISSVVGVRKTTEQLASQQVIDNAVDKVKEDIETCKQQLQQAKLKIREQPSSPKVIDNAIDKVKKDIETCKQQLQQAKLKIREQPGSQKVMDNAIDKVKKDIEACKRQLQREKLKIREQPGSLQGIDNAIDKVKDEIEKSKRQLQDAKLKIRQQFDGASELKDSVSDIVKDKISFVDEVAKSVKQQAGKKKISIKKEVEETADDFKEVFKELKNLNQELQNAFTPHIAIGCLVPIILAILGLVLGENWPARIGFAFVFLCFGAVIFGLAVAWGQAWYYKKRIVPRLRILRRKWKLSQTQVLKLTEKSLTGVVSPPLLEQLKKKQGSFDDM